MSDAMAVLLTCAPVFGLVVGVASVVSRRDPQRRRELFTNLYAAVLALFVISGFITAVFESLSRAVWWVVLGAIFLTLSSVVAYGLSSLLFSSRTRR